MDNLKNTICQRTVYRLSFCRANVFLKLWLVMACVVMCPVFVVASNHLQQQERVVSGTVFDENGEPMISVTVQQIGTGNGTITDTDGHFSLRVSGQSRVQLKFTFVGYDPQTITVGSKNTLVVKLQPASNNLEEAVVVGYGVQKKVSLTGAISSVSNSNLKKSPSPRLDNALQGHIAGLVSYQNGGGQPGVDGATMFLRGVSSTTNTAPLVLVDGVERNIIGSIDPNEVQSISVLKDASATAVFGVRGANGVILITTRRGALGKLELNVNVEQTFTAFTRRTGRLHATDYMRLKNEALQNDGLPAQYSEEMIGRFTNPLQGLDMSAPDAERQIALRRYLYCDHDYVHEFFKTWTPQTKINVNMSGGTEKLKYFLNAAYIYQGGNLKTESKDFLGYDPSIHMDRWSFRSNLDYQLTSHLKASLNLSTYIQQNNMPAAGTLYGGDQSWLVRDIFYQTSIIPPIAAGPTTMEGMDVPGGMVVDPDNIDRNPFMLINRRGFYNQTGVSLQSQLAVEWDLGSLLTPGLSVKGMLAYDAYGNRLSGGNQTQTSYRVVPDYAAGTFTYSITNPTPVPYALWFNHNADFKVNGQLSVNYARSFGPHSVSGMMLAQRDYNESAGIPHNVVGVSGRVTYSYDNRYLIEGNVGYNGSEQFSPEKRFGLFPAISLGWVVSNEAFLKRFTWLDNLKLRFSRGVVGSDTAPRFLYLDNITVSSTQYVKGLSNGNVGSIRQGMIGNPHITWERSDKSNVGFDLGLFRDLTFSFNYFYEKRSNILIRRNSLPAFQGVPLANIPMENLGRVNNHGIELEASYRKQLGKDWQIGLQANLSTNRNKVIYWDEVQRSEDYIYRKRIEGYPLYQNWGYAIDYEHNKGYFVSKEDIAESGLTYSFGHPRPGDFRYVDQNHDKVIDDKDIVPLKSSSIPGLSYGFNLTASYKNVDCSLFFTGLGQYAQTYSGHNVYEVDGNGSYFDYHRKAWTLERWQSGEEITYPALTKSGSTNLVANSFFVQDRSFLRLRNVQVGYTLPATWLQKLHIKSCRIYVTGNNVFVWDKLHTKHLDPEQGDPIGYPVTKNWSIGMNINL